MHAAAGRRRAGKICHAATPRALTPVRKFEIENVGKNNSFNFLAVTQTVTLVEGVPGAHRCPRDSRALIWSIFGSILPNHLNMLKTVFWGALLVATSLLNTYTKLYQNRIKIGRVMSKILYAHIWTYAANIIDFGPLIGQISIFLN